MVFKSKATITKVLKLKYDDTRRLELVVDSGTKRTSSSAGVELLVVCSPIACFRCAALGTAPFVLGLGWTTS